MINPDNATHAKVATVNAGGVDKKEASSWSQVPTASLWLLIPAAGGEILLSGVMFLIGFWLRFGELPAYAFGFAVFLAVLQILLIVGLRFVNRTDAHTTVALRGDWVDKVGGFWLVACAFGALLGWICGSLATGFPTYRQTLQIAEVLVTIILPVITMLPNARYMSRNAAYIQVPLLMLITLLPILVGIDAVIDLLNINTR